MPDWKDLVRFLDRVPTLFKERTTPCALFSSEGRLHSANCAFLDMLGLRDIEHLQEGDVAEEVGISVFLRSMPFVTAANGVDQSDVDGELYPFGFGKQRGLIKVSISFRPAIFDGSLVGVFVELSDFGEMARLTREVQELSRFEQDLRTLFDGLPEPATSIGLDGLYLRINPATERLYGYMTEDLVGEHMSKLFPNHRNPLDKILEQVIKSFSVHYEATAVRKDGVRIRVSGLVVPQIVDFAVVGMYEFPRLVGAPRSKVDFDKDHPNARSKKRFIAESVSSRELVSPDHAGADRET